MCATVRRGVIVMSRLEYAKALQSLLPPNASEFEKVVEKSIAYYVDCSSLSGFKFNDADGLKLNLIWEYSLSFVNIEDIEERIRQGLKFHRLNGTPYALKLALSWYGLTNITIEEEEPGAHFAEFQLGFKEIPSSFSIYQTIEVANTAKPLRSRLVRMFNDGYDVRRFILDKSDWGDILSDDSGIYLYEGSPKISFGRSVTYEAALPEIIGNYHVTLFTVVFAKIDDSFKLDFAYLDDGLFSEINEDNHYFAERSSKNEDFIGDLLPDSLVRPATFSRACIILSDSVLDDGQSCFCGSYELLNDEKFTLDLNLLSESKANPENIFIDKRLFFNKKADAAYNGVIETTDMLYRGIATYMGKLTSKIEVMNDETVCKTGRWLGNSTWHDHRHFNVPWIEQNFYSEMS